VQEQYAIYIDWVERTVYYDYRSRGNPTFVVHIIAVVLARGTRYFGITAELIPIPVTTAVIS